jgi:hypothetical protein
MANVIKDDEEPQFANPASSWRRYGLRRVRDFCRAVIESWTMRIQMYSNEIEAPLTSFIGKFVGNVCLAAVSSLKIPLPIKTLKYEIEGESVRIWVNDYPVPLNMSQGFSRIIVLDTLRGMIRHLKMDDPNGKIRIEIDTEIEQ